ncbi:MAG: sigma-54 dependent transcriptional regulator [Pseudomonadota bacterium]
MYKKKIILIAKDTNLVDSLLATLLATGLDLYRCNNNADAFMELTRTKYDLVVTDINSNMDDMHSFIGNVRQFQPKLPILILTDYETVPRASAAIKAGASDYVIKPFDPCLLAEMVNTLLQEVAQPSDLIIADPKSILIANLARKVAESNATVMISGESGTGKEVIARYIHESSPRAHKPFMAINCAAIPETMLESILFGYEKGSFTGAHAAKPGKFEQANHGTLLLDEISEMDLGLQAKLLRVIQEREVERLGGSKPIALDVRIIATTNRNLKLEVQQGRFREDLFYRLNVFPLNLPPLNQRRGDILPMANKFLEVYQPGGGFILDEAAQLALLMHRWQGNVRELGNVIQRALILATGKLIGRDEILFEELSMEENLPLAAALPTQPGEKKLDSDLRSLEKEIIINAVSTNHSRKEAAEKLGISQRTLRYKLAQFRKAGMAIPA